MSSRADRRVAVVVPNWNGASFLGATLEALAAQTCPATEVIVVDNGSTDGSADLLARDFPWVRVVRLARNSGFAGAANAGIDATDAGLVAVLNSDARPRPDWLQVLLAQPDDPTVWAWGSVLVDPNGTVESAGDHYSPRGYAFKLGRGMQLDDLPPTPYGVIAPPGAAPLMRRRVLQQLDGYAERFFLYYEDVDLSLRALLAGYHAVLVPDAVVEHDMGRSSRRRSRPWFYIGRNSLWCAVRCLPDVPVRTLARRSRQEWRTARGRGAGAAYAAGRLAGVLGLPWALATRHAIQAQRRVDAAALRAMFTNPPIPAVPVAASTHPAAVAASTHRVAP
ncbi:MAG TPA: glycosyltransferase family 2 protein [Mycobacteriales bacterium]|jgi:GT2 family glycosyltransferase|nr:glycosyltransferase family 2 protein [Mycobacteriales bacterium]